MKIGSPTIEFLGATIGQSTIKLQPYVISKIADFKEQELSTTKGLRSWLGLLNYARSYIPNLGRLLGPLYAKTSPTGEKKMNFQDLELITKIKKIIKELPDLSIPPSDCFIIIEADGCMEGWGGICKWKPKKIMDSCGEGSSNTSPDRGSLTIDQGQTQFDGIPTPSGPYELLQQYEELACYTGRTSIYNKEEHDKRSHMADIEWTATKHILSSIRELEFICQLKESDFRKRSHFQGQDTYCQKALPAVNEARIELFKLPVDSCGWPEFEWVLGGVGWKAFGSNISGNDLSAEAFNSGADATNVVSSFQHHTSAGRAFFLHEATTATPPLCPSRSSFLADRKPCPNRPGRFPLSRLLCPAADPQQSTPTIECRRHPISDCPTISRHCLVVDSFLCSSHRWIAVVGRNLSRFWVVLAGKLFVATSPAVSYRLRHSTLVSDIPFDWLILMLG
ncbi:hypothetical protein ZIOFF_006348 [Zingiber officinale]|uniref:Uncharacterized protein n=1 Tax=Zingiber officinale TaxID=94328 RepID=A0A8J5HVI7_ZINOF|nr:hypothetical protein ZIOFF_006348 [Zingiber officinale]